MEGIEIVDFQPEGYKPLVDYESWRVAVLKFCDDLLDQKGVLVCHGDCFYIPHTFRITLSHAHELEEGLRRIDEYIDELVAQGKSIKN